MNLMYAKRSEETEQIHVIEWKNVSMNRYPELKHLHHTPNGGKRNGKEAKKLKQMGVEPGVPDLHLPVAKGAYHGLYIEMKYGDNTLTKEQKEFLKDMQDGGYSAVVCHSAMTATLVIEKYINLYDRQLLTLDGICSEAAGVDGKYDSNGIMHVF